MGVTTIVVLFVFALVAFVQCDSLSPKKYNYKHDIIHNNFKPKLQWYTTKSTSLAMTDPKIAELVDFRGCYETECVYISASPLPATGPNALPTQSIGTSRALGSFRKTEHKSMWAVATSVNTFSTNKNKIQAEYTIDFVLSKDRPEELASTLWISPVADHTVLPSVFEPEPFMKAQMQPDPHVAEFVDAVESERIRAHVSDLASFHTRNSYSNDASEAASYLQSLVTSYGCQNAFLQDFNANMAPNVICEIPGYDAAAPAVVVGAHYDSRSTGVNDPNQLAPGADDNGSGSGSVLEIIRIAADLSNTEGYSFRRKLIFAFFAGEEQGLVGSSFLARQYRSQGVALAAMVNLDMTGWPQPNAPRTLYWMSGSTNANLTNLAFSVTQTYLGGDTVVARTGACCSDQQSFHSQGYPAASVFESLSAGNNPNYHRSSDAPSTVNYEHVWRNAKSAAALIATLAEIRGPL